MLLNGDIDFLYGEPYEALEQIERTDGLKLARGPQFNVHGLASIKAAPTCGRPTSRAGSLPRQAGAPGCLPSDRHSDAGPKRFIGGLRSRSGCHCPRRNGYPPELARRPPCDPAGPKRCWRRPASKGFSVTLDCPNDWSRARGEALCRFIAPQLAAIGMGITVNFQPAASTRRGNRFLHGRLDRRFPQHTLLALYHSRGVNNTRGYANPRIDELIDKIQHELVGPRCHDRGGLEGRNRRHRVRAAVSVLRCMAHAQSRPLPRPPPGAAFSLGLRFS